VARGTAEDAMSKQLWVGWLFAPRGRGFGSGACNLFPNGVCRNVTGRNEPR
jgi:hypothetical protein